MNITIVIGGAAGQGINKVSEIVSKILSKYGYFTFNYRDYPSLIRGGHNYNKLSASDSPISSNESKIDVLVALDERTLAEHENEKKENCIIISHKKVEKEGRNINIALAGSLSKALGIPLSFLEEEVKSEFKKSDEAVASAKRGYDLQEEKMTPLPKLSNQITSILTGSKAIALGAQNASLDAYIAYPMTPATNALHEIAKNQIQNNMIVFQAENEISVANMALGASFAGAKVMIGTSGGGFDLMGEALSLQGASNVPLTVYLAARPGPGTGVPTYTAQGDLNIALRAGHGEFPRVVIAPGDPLDTIEKTAEALMLAEKFKLLSIILSDKHISESEFSSNKASAKELPFSVQRAVPGEKIVKASSYEQNSEGNTTEEAEQVEKNMDERIQRYENAKEYIEDNLRMIQVHGNRNSENLIIGWGGTTGAIKDAIREIDAKFLQIIYMKPLSPQIREEIEKSKKVIIVETNATGQLGRLIREKTGIKIPNRILKYDGRPFHSDELKQHLQEML